MSGWVDVSIFKRNRPFTLLFIGQFVSFIGTTMTAVALPYQIYEATHSSLQVGLLSLVQLLPLLFTALIGGVFADRHARQRLLIVSDVLLMVCCIFLALNASWHHDQVVILYILASLMSAITGLHRPAFDGLIQQIVMHEDYKAVGALHSFQFSFGMIVGPAIAGLMIAALGVTLTYWIDALSFLISLCMLLLMQSFPKPQSDPAVPVWSALKEGIQFAWSRPVLMGSYVVDFMAMVFSMPNALFPAIALSIGGAKTLGLLFSAPAVGALVMSIWSGWTAAIKREGQAIAVSAIAWGLAVIAFGLSHHLMSTLFFLAVAGAADAASGIFRSSLWNHTIPSEFRGRLAGIEMLSYLSGPKLGDFRAGMMAQTLGIGPAVVSGGIFCIVGVSWCCYRMKAFWHYKSP